MPSPTYRDLRAFGLEFVTPENLEFPALLWQIQNRPNPLGPQAVMDNNSAAAILVNQSGKAVIALAHVWKYTEAGGHVRTSRCSNLGSSMQMDVLAGRTEVTRDRFSFILPGSKRLITEDGMFGDNFDVLPPESGPVRGSIVGSGGGGHLRAGEKEIVAIELYLDVAIFEDGLCVGPDEFGLFQSVTEGLQQQRGTAQEIVETLRRGESVGRVFEILRPLASHTPPAPATRRARHPARTLSMFASTAIHHLIDMTDSDVMAWFEQAAQPPRISLHRPSEDR